ncbi:MAG TPA: hypothetical protein VFS33_07615 [Gemmatimonadales bacterium]|nr:hypothetical protein [Gemmatimonadales bacterium]
MRKLLVLAAFAVVAACHRQSDTDVGQASPDTGRTTSDTAMTAPPSSGQTGQTGYGTSADSVGNRGDTAMVNRSVPDTTNPSATTDAAQPPAQTSDTSSMQPGATGQTGISTDSIGNRGDSAAVNRSVPDTSSNQGWSQPSPSGQSTTDSTRPPKQH